MYWWQRALGQQPEPTPEPTQPPIPDVHVYSAEETAGWDKEYQEGLAAFVERKLSTVPEANRPYYRPQTGREQIRLALSIYPKDHPKYLRAKGKREELTAPPKKIEKVPETKLGVYDVETTRGTVQIVSDSELTVRAKAIEQFRADFADVDKPVTSVGEITVIGDRNVGLRFAQQRADEGEIQAGDVVFPTPEVDDRGEVTLRWATIPSEMYKEITTTPAITFTLQTDKGLKKFIAKDEEWAIREAESYGLKVTGVESQEEITLTQAKIQDILTTAKQRGSPQYLAALFKTGIISQNLSPHIVEDGQLDIVGALQDPNVSDDDILTAIPEETLEDVKAQIAAQPIETYLEGEPEVTLPTPPATPTAMPSDDWKAYLEGAIGQIPTLTIKPSDVGLPGWMDLPRGGQRRPNVDLTFEVDWDIGNDIYIYHEGKKVGVLDVETGDIKLDNPDYILRVMTPSYWERQRLKTEGKYPTEAILAAWLKASEWLYSPKQVDVTPDVAGRVTPLDPTLAPPEQVTITLPAPATVLGIIGLVSSIAVTGSQGIQALRLFLNTSTTVGRAYVRLPGATISGKPKPSPSVAGTVAEVKMYKVYQRTAIYRDWQTLVNQTKISPTSTKYVHIDGELFRAFQFYQYGNAPQTAQQILDQVRAAFPIPGAVSPRRAIVPFTGIPGVTPPTVPPTPTLPTGLMPAVVPPSPVVPPLGVGMAVTGISAIPGIMPTGVPPMPPEATMMGRTGNEYTGFLADLQDAGVVADIAFRNDAVRRWVNRLPGLRNFMKVLNPSVVADKPATQAIVIRATLRDEGYQKTQGVMAHLNQIGSQEGIFGKLSAEGFIKTGSLQGQTLGDIAQSRVRWEAKLTPEQRQWLDQAKEIENAVAEFLIRNGIDINLLRLEEGGQFATRRVWAKTLADGTILDVAYVGAGPGRPGARLPTEKHRVFLTEAEAIAEGYRYIPYEEALYLKVAGAYNRVADKEMADWVLGQVPWRTTGAPEELKVAAYAANQKKRYSQMLLAAMNRAARGERVPVQTINAIASFYPDQAEQLRNIIAKIQAGEKATLEIRNLRNVAKGLIETDTMMSLRAVNARARAREAALQVKIGEAMVPAPAFAGKILTGEEAKETARILRESFEARFNKALAEVNKANAVARYFMLAGDYSPFMIQLIFLMGQNPKIYGKAFGGAVRAMLSPEFHSKFLANHKATIDKHPNLLISKGGATEFTEAMAPGGWLSGKINFRPQAERYWKSLALFLPRAMGKLGATALTPFQRVFEYALDSAGIYMAEAYDYSCTTPEKTFDIDQFINEFRGLTSSARIGVTPLERQLETAGVLAPRYNRAIAGLIVDLGRGNIRGKLARESLVKGIAAICAMAVAISMLRGESEEEILEHFNPLSSMFLTWEIGGQKVGPGSKIRSLIKLWAQSADNPESLLQLSMDNPALRFIRGNLSPVVGSGIDLITGRSYIGDPTRDGLLSFSEEILAGNLLPIWLQSVLLEGGDLQGRTIRGIAEFFGWRGYPEPLWDEVGRLRDKYAKQDFNIKYEDLNRQQIDELGSNHPDLKELEIKAELETAERGTEKDQWMYNARQQVVQERNDALETLAAQLLAGQITKEQYDKERGYLRPYYSGAKGVLWEVREFLDPYGVKQISRWMDENLSPEDKALDKYLEYRADLIQKADLPIDWNKIQSQSEEYLSNLTKNTREYVENNVSRWINDLPSSAKEVEQMRLQGVETGEWWDGYGELGIVPEILSPEEATKKIAVRLAVKNWGDILDAYDNVDTGAKIDYRVSHPQSDAMLFLAGKVATLRTGDARLALIKLMQKYDIRAEDVYGVRDPSQYEDLKANHDAYEGAGLVGKPIPENTPLPQQEKWEEWKADYNRYEQYEWSFRKYEFVNRLKTKIEGTSLTSAQLLSATRSYEGDEINLSEQPKADAIVCWVEVKTTNHGFPETEEGWGKLEELMSEANVDYAFIFGEDVANQIGKVKIYHTKIFDEEDDEFKSLTSTEKKALSFIDPEFEKLGVELWNWTPIDRASLSLRDEARYRIIARTKGWDTPTEITSSPEIETYWWQK